MYMSGMCSGVGNFRPMHENRAAREGRPELMCVNYDYLSSVAQNSTVALLSVKDAVAAS